MMADPLILQIKYAAVIELFAHETDISLDEALKFFYHSTVYQLMKDGISEMHCMSDAYLAEDLKREFLKLGIRN